MKNKLEKCDGEFCNKDWHKKVDLTSIKDGIWLDHYCKSCLYKLDNANLLEWSPCPSDGRNGYQI